MTLGDKPGNDRGGMAGDTKTPLPLRKAELLTSELVGERVHVLRLWFAETAMPGKRLIDVAGIKPDSSGKDPRLTCRDN